jgi:hypothetical protein
MNQTVHFVDTFETLKIAGVLLGEHSCKLGIDNTKKRLVLTIYKGIEDGPEARAVQLVVNGNGDFQIRQRTAEGLRVLRWDEDWKLRFLPGAAYAPLGQTPLDLNLGFDLLWGGDGGTAK